MVFIDSDVLAYRASFSATGKPLQKAYDKVDELMKFILDSTVMFSNGKDYRSFLTGKGNFRFDVGVTYPYKGNRESLSKPVHLQDVRDYICSEWRGEVIQGQEADDQMAIEATKGPLGEVAIASIDKDMLQVPGWHFNFGKNEWHWSTEEFGLQFLYTQMLTGDVADNIRGIYGVGPKKAAKIIGNETSEVELYNRVLNAYDGDKARVLENARLLYLRRTEDEMWLPPMERSNYES